MSNQNRRRFLEFFQCVEETVEQVVAGGWDQEYVRVRDTPSSGIHADEINLVFLEHPFRNGPGGLEQALDLLVIQIMPPGHMTFGDYQAVALCKRIDVQDAQGKFVFVNLVRVFPARHDLTENAFFRFGHRFSLNMRRPENHTTEFVFGEYDLVYGRISAQAGIRNGSSVRRTC